MKDREFWLEEQYHGRERGESRKERKEASAKDRSKYKKTDQDQIKKREVKLPEGNFKKGRVLSINVEGIVVASDDAIYLCQLRGALKKEKTQLKNLIAVGDFVLFTEKGKQEGTIAFIEERFSILSRADNLSRKKEQLIAVNIDQVLITLSVLLPPLKPFLIDRYIIAAEKGNMKPVIVINKIDLLDTPPIEADHEERALYEEVKSTYSRLGYPFHEVSTMTGKGLDELKEIMKGKTSVFSGQSGVGKSSLMNALFGTEMAVGDLSIKTFKGSHTTTTTHLIPISGGGFCIDTPGITSFGVWNLESGDVRAYFPDILEIGEKCKFLDCTHLNEPDCAVQKAVEEGHLSSLRFASYSALMSSLESEHKKR